MGYHPVTLRVKAPIFALYCTRTYFIDGKNIRHVLPVKCNLLNLPLFVIPVGSYTSLSIVVYKILCYTQCTQLYFPKYLGTKFSTGTCTVVAYPPGKFMQFIFLIIFFLRRPEKNANWALLRKNWQKEFHTNDTQRRGWPSWWSVSSLMEF